MTTIISTQTGRCLCGTITYSYDAAPVFTAICHCTDCAKLSTSTVLQIPSQNFQITSPTTPKKFTKTSDFNNEITSHFCPECGVTLFRSGGAKEVEGLVGVRGGTLDDWETLTTKPGIEVFVDKRPGWRGRVEGALQMDSKYAVVEEGSGSSEVLDEVKRRGAGAGDV